MKHLDKTRDNIRVNSLDDDSRKDLFKKFTEAGGEVIKEKRAKPIIFDREKQRHIAAKLDSHQKKTKFVPKKKQQTGQQNAVGKKTANYQGGFADSFSTKLALFFSGITSLSGRRLKKSFMESFSSEYKTALIELQMIYLDVFRANPIAGEKITYQLDSFKPLYFELIEMTADLYDKTLIGQIVDQYTAFPAEEMRTRDYQIPILAFFKKMFPLYLYVNSIYAAYEKAIELQEKIAKDKSSSYSAKRKKANNSIYIVFNKLFPKLYKLFCYYHGASVPLHETALIDEILMIGPDMRPGMRTASAPSRFSDNYAEISAQTKAKQEEEKKEAIEELKKKHVKVIAPEVQRGLELMKNLRFDTLKSAYLQNNELAQNIPATDPVMRAYLLFVEFDRQYSMILTTSKIKYNIFYDKTGKKDYKAVMADMFNSIRGCEESVKQYFSSWDNFKRASEEQVPKDYYLNHQKKLMEIEREIKIKGINARNSIRNFMNQLTDTVTYILEDIKNVGRIISNSADILQSDQDISITQRLSGKSIQDALVEVNDYAQALLYRLSGEGDLNKEIVTSGTEVSPAEGENSNSSSEKKEPKEDYNPDDNSILSQLGRLDDHL